jgi:hypothetical protein
MMWSRYPFWTILFATLATTVLFLLGYAGLDQKNTLRAGFDGIRSFAKKRGDDDENVAQVLDELCSFGVYNETDFVNEKGISPPFWSCLDERCERFYDGNREWGPCFATHGDVQWEEEIDKYEKEGPSYNPRMKAPPKVRNDLSGLCRPGFLIIGAGKCGTSSLYHYLTDHPKVLPAKEKQIHYFKYFASRSMIWYLNHFPTATSFLASGALMTGEASPGYLPYPDVAEMVLSRMPGPRIIAVGREPIDRAYSSYRYNYVTPTLQLMRKGSVLGVKRGQPDEYYEQYLFSFEDMMKAELSVLRECLAPDGSAVLGAREKWGSKGWAQVEYDRRERLGLEPLVDLDGFCYGKLVNSKVIRRQWADLMEQYPEKVIESKNVHLQQSMIGRGLYALPLEWWYAVFRRDDIFFVCTEDLSDLSGEPLNELGGFLGLPPFNFSDTIRKGAYNVGGHRGYDKEISWTEIERERENSDESGSDEKANIPLSAEFRKELSDFIGPYNERLFALIGRRCDW